MHWGTLPSRLSRCMVILFLNTFARQHWSVVLVVFLKPRIIYSLPLGRPFLVVLRTSNRPVFRIDKIAQVVPNTLCVQIQCALEGSGGRVWRNGGESTRVAQIAFSWRQTNNFDCPIGDIARLLKGVADLKVTAQDVTIVILEPFDIQFSGTTVLLAQSLRYPN